jgi:hypothetical protein
MNPQIDRDNDDFVATFADAPDGHSRSKSTAVEITIPCDDPYVTLVLCISSVSCINGKVDVKSSVEKRERKRSDGTTPTPKEVVILKDHYTLDVSHVFPGNRQETEPIDFHSHE